MTDTPTDVSAQFDRYAAERDATTDIGAAVAAELARIRSAEAEQENAAELARLAGGPCGGCGTTLSIVLQDYADEHGNAAVRSQLQPFWRPCEHAQLCYSCTQLLGTGVMLADLKAAVIYNLLPADEAKFWMHPALAQRLRDYPILWCEQSPRPSTCDFGWIDMSAARAALDPPKPEYFTDAPCVKCGTSDMFVFDPGGETQIFDRDGRASLATIAASTFCAGCATRPPSPIEASKDPAAPAAPVWLGGPIGSPDPLAPAKAAS